MKYLSLILALGMTLTVACGDDDTVLDASPDMMINTDGDTADVDTPDQDIPDADAPTQNIVEIAAGNPDFSTLVSAVTAAGLADTLAGEGPFTVFAPTNDAFAALPAGLVDSLTPEQLAAVLTYHVVPLDVPASAALELTEADTVEGAKINLAVNGGKLYLNGLTEVVTTDIKATNGTIHVIDSVIFKPTPGFPGDIPAAVAAYPRLSTLAGAVSEGIGAALAGDDVTLLAPVNTAFDGVELPSDQADLDAVLAYHAIGANAPAATVVSLATTKTVNGAYLAIKADDDGVKLNDASKDVNVIYTDITTTNGVIHLLDGVLIPPGNIVEVAMTVPDLSDLVATVVAADTMVPAANLVATLSGTDEFTVLAPTNAAFAALGTAPSGQALVDVLTYHVIPGAADSNAVAAAIADAAGKVATVNGAEVTFSLDGTDVKADAATVVIKDVPTANGIVHVIDTVIVPAI